MCFLGHIPNMLRSHYGLPQRHESHMLQNGISESMALPNTGFDFPFGSPWFSNQLSPFDSLAHNMLSGSHFGESGHGGSYQSNGKVVYLTIYIIVFFLF